MAHDVEFTVPARPLGRADVEFAVNKDGELLGTLAVSNGSLVWFPRSTTNGHKIGWEEFDQLMKEQTTRIERR